MLPKTIMLFSFAVTLMVYSACGQSLQGMKRLMANLTSNYDKRIRPVNNQTSPVFVYVDFILLSLQDLINAEERLSIVAEMNIKWNDANMVWDPSSFENITKVFFTYNDVWVPDLVLSNCYDHISTFGEDWQRITYTYDGNASWYVGNVMHTRCTLDLTFYPNDTQTCTISLYPRGYSYTEVMLYKVSDQVQKNLYADDESWKLLGTSTKAYNNTDRSLIEFTLTFSRQSNYVVLKTLVASSFFGMVNVLVFWLPPESEERISCATTLMLSIIIFQADVEIDLPKWPEKILLRNYLQIELYTSTLITLMTMVTTKIYHDKIPYIVKPLIGLIHLLSLLLSLLTCCLCTSKVTPKDETLSIENEHKKRRNVCKIVDRFSLLVFFLSKIINFFWFVAEINEKREKNL